MLCSRHVVQLREEVEGKIQSGGVRVPPHTFRQRLVVESRDVSAQFCKWPPYNAVHNYINFSNFIYNLDFLP